MDIQSFIQSGLLEAYALGQCSAEERALVERMVAGHAEVRAELAAIEKALEGYAAANATPPPAWMKGRILDTIQNEAVPPAPPRSGSLRLFQLLTPALAILAAFLFFRNNTLSSEKTALASRAAELQHQIDDCAEKGLQMDKLQQVNRLLRDRDTRDVPLSNGENGKFTGYAYHNAARCETALDLTSLPAPAPGKYFQFWSIADGKPVSMGMVDLQAAGGWLVFPCRQNAAALAISQEDKPGGNPTPTEVLLVGNIPAG